MKIEIDLDEILGDGDCTETLSDSVRRQVVQKVTEIVTKGVGKRIESEVSRVLNEAIASAVADQMPTIVDDLISAEYVCVDRWGQANKETTTFRKELVKSIHEQMTYKKVQYDSDKNIFTKSVDRVIEAETQKFQTEFNKTVNAQFVAEAMAYATKKLQEKLQVK